uniref:Uncharacterized protein n=1 Tax=Avena sativa TaxID=4498 RepID=A0ACD5ZCF4_AVESA
MLQRTPTTAIPSTKHPIVGIPSAARAPHRDSFCNAPTYEALFPLPWHMLRESTCAAGESNPPRHIPLLLALTRFVFCAHSPPVNSRPHRPTLLDRLSAATSCPTATPSATTGSSSLPGRFGRDPHGHRLSMESERQPPAAASAAISKVLDNDDLLIEILLHVGFATNLVRVALVCKYWLRHVSDPKFLHRFHKLHPSTLLGFYIGAGPALHTPHFVPMQPQPPELAAIISHTSFSLDCDQKVLTFIRDCRDGRVFTTRREGSELIHRVYNPLFPEKGMSITPPIPCYQQQDDYYCCMSQILSVKEGDDLSYFHVLVASKKDRTKSMVHVYILRPGHDAWRTHLTLATDPLPDNWVTKFMLSDNKIYMHGVWSDIVVLDLVASSSSTIRLPQGMEYGDRDAMLSRADDASGVYLIQAKELQLRIWLHKGDNWLMVDTICLVEMCANLRMSDCTGEEEQAAVLRIKQVGDNAEFVFLQMGRYILYLDIKCRTLRKVHEMADKDQCFYVHIYPFKMIWPPTFPPLKDDLQGMPFAL